MCCPSEGITLIDQKANHKVEGHLDESWSDRLGGMRTTMGRRKDKTMGTTLVGRIRDQAELTGVLSTLYDLHLPILSVENLTANNGEAGRDPDQSSPSGPEGEENTE